MKLKCSECKFWYPVTKSLDGGYCDADNTGLKNVKCAFISKESLISQGEIIKKQQKRIRDLREVAIALLEWIDVIPKNKQLPVMPEIDRDWIDSVIKGEK